MLFPDHHHEKTRNLVALLGIERSGTSMLGNLLASFKGAEYSFEPALLSYYEAASIEGKLDPEEIAGVLRTYFAQDIMMDGVHGRGYNLRPGDETCVLNFKSYADVMGRWTSIGNTSDALKYYSGHPELRIIVKVASIYNVIPVLMEAFPAMQLVEIRRNLAPVVASILSKRWYHDDSIRNAPHMLTWPLAAVEDGVQIPYFVPQKDFGFWIRSNEMTRAVYACIQSAKGSLALKRSLADTRRLGRILDVPYESMVAAPREPLKRIAAYLGMRFGEQTEALIGKIDLSRAKAGDPGIQAQCEKNLYAEFTEINKLYSNTRHENWDI